MYIDTHCHLSKDYYEEIDDVIHENRSNEIEIIIISGCDQRGIDESINYTLQYEDVYATIGYHPEEALSVSDHDLQKLEENVKNNSKVIGIGEIGLDYHYGKDYHKEQISLFEKQLAIAEKLNLPVVIHSRDAVMDTIHCLKKYHVKGIIHCFSGSLEIANVYIKMGFKLGIGGVVTFKNSKLSQILEEISIEHIVLETDSPYLTPDPYRGKINSSKYIPIIAHKLGQIYHLSKEEVGKITTNNVLALFKF